MTSLIFHFLNKLNRESFKKIVAIYQSDKLGKVLLNPLYCISMPIATITYLKIITLLCCHLSGEIDEVGNIIKHYGGKFSGLVRHSKSILCMSLRGRAKLGQVVYMCV